MQNKAVYRDRNIRKKMLQLLMEETYNRKAIRKRVMTDIMEFTNDSLLKKVEIAVIYVKEYLTRNHGYESKNMRVRKLRHGELTEEEIVYEVIAAVALSDEPQPIQAVAARLGNHLDLEDPIDAAKTASELLAVVCQSDLFDIQAAMNTETGTMMVKSRFCLEEDTIRAIEHTQYLPPMVCRPNKIKASKDNMDTSHITFVDSLLLGKENQHNEFICTDVINIANRVKLSLDEDVLMFEEESNKPLDTPEKLKQFTKMATDSVRVYNEIISAGNEFYLTWKYDFRGRMYSQGYHINIQSTDYKKALINFAKKEVITT